MRIHQVLTLPASLEADAMYLVLNGNYSETYVTDNSGVAKLIGNSQMINELIVTQLANVASTEIVTDIAARDALTFTSNGTVFVADATGDPNVNVGAALYVYDHANTTFILAAEYESLDHNLLLDWSAIQNKPSSSVADIDDAVSKKHEHANKPQLDLLTENSGSPLYNGKPIVTLDTNNW